MTASLARLRGDFVGSLRIHFGGHGGGSSSSSSSGGGGSGAVQDLRLHAEVLRPALTVHPPQLPFGIVRASSGSGGGGFRVAQLFLANPTSVPAPWSIRHVPAPPPQPSSTPAAHAAAALQRSGLQPGVGTLARERSGGSSGGSGSGLQWAALGLEAEAAWASAPTPAPPTDDPTVFAFAALSGCQSGPTDGAEGGGSAGTRASRGLPKPLALDVRFTPRAPLVYRSRFRFSVAHGESFEVVLSGRGTFEEV